MKNMSLLQENIPIEEVFEALRCTKEGLSCEEVRTRLEAFGYNKLEEKKVPLSPSIFYYVLTTT